MENKFTSSTLHSGGMRCYTNFTPSATTFATDVPTSLGGRGEYPTPAAMLAATVASCMLSMIAYTAGKRHVPADGICIKAACTEGDKGISGIELHVTVPSPIPHTDRKAIEAAARSCPIARSLHPDIEKKITWHWADS